MDVLKPEEILRDANEELDLIWLLDDLGYDFTEKTYTKVGQFRQEVQLAIQDVLDAHDLFLGAKAPNSSARYSKLVDCLEWMVECLEKGELVCRKTYPVTLGKQDYRMILSQAGQFKLIGLIEESNLHVVDMVFDSPNELKTELSKEIQAWMDENPSLFEGCVFPSITKWEKYSEVIKWIMESLEAGEITRKGNPPIKLPSLGYKDHILLSGEMELIEQIDSFADEYEHDSFGRPNMFKVIQEGSYKNKLEFRIALRDAIQQLLDEDPLMYTGIHAPNSNEKMLGFKVALNRILAIREMNSKGYKTLERILYEYEIQENASFSAKTFWEHYRSVCRDQAMHYYCTREAAKTDIIASLNRVWEIETEKVTKRRIDRLDSNASWTDIFNWEEVFRFS